MFKFFRKRKKKRKYKKFNVTTEIGSNNNITEYIKDLKFSDFLIAVYADTAPIVLKRVSSLNYNKNNDLPPIPKRTSSLKKSLDFL